MRKKINSRLARTKGGDSGNYQAHADAGPKLHVDSMGLEEEMWASSNVIPSFRSPAGISRRKLGVRPSHKKVVVTHMHMEKLHQVSTTFSCIRMPFGLGFTRRLYFDF